MMACPKCVAVELVGRKVKGGDEVVYRCDRCIGIWFHRGQLEAIMSRAVKELAIPENALLGARKCPECQGLMHEFDYPQTLVKIDMCGKCVGIWLDVGEAREIQTVRKGLKSEAREYNDIPGTKGQIIEFVNRALDWVMHSY